MFGINLEGVVLCWIMDWGMDSVGCGSLCIIEEI